MKKLFFPIVALLCLCQSMHAQEAITLEDIWQNYKYFARRVPGFDFLNDGKSYTRLDGNKIQQYDFTSGNFTETIFDLETVENKDIVAGAMDSYSFSDDESKILVESGSESIYRYSSRANFFIWNRSAKTLFPLFDQGKQMYATFNPKADRVAFVHENNIYYKDLESGKTVQVTKDGATNSIINGASDWVYEEELTLVRAFEWSPDGSKIAFLRFDESAVKEFTMNMYKDELYPEKVTFKYPKVGETNSTVTAHIYDLKSKKTIKVNTGDETDIYLPRIKWTGDNQLCVFRMNRHQSQLELLLANAKSGKTKPLYKENEEQYIAESILGDVTFLKNSKEFIVASERDGWYHLYLYGMDGKLKQRLTEGKWDVTSFYGVDEKKGLIYYQAAKTSSAQRHIFETDLRGKKEHRQLSTQDGWNGATFSSTFDYYVLNYSNANLAPTYTVFDRAGKVVRALEDNERIKRLQIEYATSPVEFFDFKTSEDVDLKGWMIKPADFDESKQYPVFMYLYGGPGSQQVTDRWRGPNYWWFQMLAQQGYIVACVDNRGTGGRGEEFKKMTYLQLGHYETIDQIEAAKYLGTLTYTDASRIGIFGWSYGGYMSSLCLLKGNDVFKAAIAVAPVTSWKWYDTIYTERFMRTLKENEDGYKDNSPIYFADRLEGNYLLIHGIGDDNVHFQHTVEMSNALISANKQFDTYFYPNRNHGIYGDGARLHLYTKMTNFLEEKLKN